MLERIDRSTNARIRQAVSETELRNVLHFLADRFGPRLTGSPQHEASVKWAVTKFKEWGIDNARAEPWDFEHAGWENEQATGYLVEPVRARLTYQVHFPQMPGNALPFGDGSHDATKRVIST